MSDKVGFLHKFSKWVILRLEGVYTSTLASLSDGSDMQKRLLFDAHESHIEKIVYTSNIITLIVYGISLFSAILSAFSYLANLN